MPVEWLLQKADGMFPEGQGGPRAFAKDGAAKEKTNELLENAMTAIEELFKQRGYDPKKPEEVKAKLGYALDRYEAAAYLVTGAMHLPLLSQPEAWTIGKRIKNIIGESGPAPPILAHQIVTELVKTYRMNIVSKLRPTITL